MLEDAVFIQATYEITQNTKPKQVQTIQQQFPTCTHNLITGHKRNNFIQTLHAKELVL
jgi:hypothetical protein